MYPNMSNPNKRKRTTPNASTLIPLPQTYQPTGPSDSMVRWGGATGVDGTAFADGSGRGINNFTNMAASAQAQFGQGLASSPSTTIARRPMNNALVPSTIRPHLTGWTGFEDQGFLQPSSTEVMEAQDSLDVLLERAQRAKRDAASRRKQIPPFVQKLSSFLNEQKNTELIRWSEKGDSFIVVDEDEFAKTLIPELFKHNNYASFVRQLNMYGFHKRVGLSDNSMKASERKNKSPSEYHNPFFRKGYPDLLWLINKPKSNAGKKKKREDGDPDSDDDVAVVDDAGPGPTQAHGHGHRALSSEYNHTLQKKDLSLVRDQLDHLQETQAKMQTAITRISQDQKDLINQAVLFQQLHDRHDRSINLILSFLANVYRKSLDDSQGQGPQSTNVADVLASLLPSQNQPPQGTVFDFQNLTNLTNQATVTPPKRQQRLLPPIPRHQQHPRHSAPPAPAPPSQPTPTAPYTGTPHFPQMGSVTEVIEPPTADQTTPAYLKHTLENHPHESMMKIMEDATSAAPSVSNVEIPAAVASAASVLSNDQRDQMLNIMAQQSSAAPSNATMSSPATRTMGSNSSVASRASSAAPAMQQSMSRPRGNGGHGVNMDMSPPTRVVPMHAVPTSAAMPSTPVSAPNSHAQAAQQALHALAAPSPPLSLEQLGHENTQIHELQRLTEDQASTLNDLAHVLGPLSPSGRIPGCDEHGNPIPTPGDQGGGYFDINQFLNTDEFRDDGTGTGDVGFDTSGLGPDGVGVGGVGIDGTGHDLAGFALGGSNFKVDSGMEGVVEPASPTGTEEVEREDLGVGTDGEFDFGEREVKRQRI